MLKWIKTKDLFYWVAGLPVLGFLYRTAYKINIGRKLKNFNISDIIVTIEPSNFCNSQCSMCPYHKMTRKKETMSMELFKKAVDDCRSCGVTKFNLNFYNEPFLDQAIFERIKYLKSKGVRTQLFSNASVLNGDKIDKIIESGLNDIKFSVDGAKKETYEKIRKGLNFDKTVSNILKLIERKKELGSANPIISVVFVRGGLNESEVEEFKNFWTGKTDKVIISYDDNRNETSEFFNGRFVKKTAYPCRKLWTEFVIMSSGKVALCCIDSDGSVILGDFNSQNLKEIWDGEKFKEIRKTHLDYKADKIPICKTCVHPYRMNMKNWWR